MTCEVRSLRKVVSKKRKIPPLAGRTHGRRSPASLQEPAGLTGRRSPLRTLYSVLRTLHSRTLNRSGKETPLKVTEEGIRDLEKALPKLKVH